jgi:ADP-ribose pyrophosphatase
MKIPQNATLVFKGKIFDTYQWEQEMYDGSTATFEALKRPDTIQIIPTTDNPSAPFGSAQGVGSGQAKILIAEEEQPNKPLSDSLLGGRIEEGEEPLVAAKRELLEESGMESSDWELLKTFENNGKIEWNVYLFVARNCRKVAEPNLDPGEKIEVKEVSFEQFLDIVSSENFWGQDIANYILRLRLNQNKLEEFRDKLFH